MTLLDLLRKLRRHNPAVAPREDAPPRIAEATRALREAEQVRREVELREPTVLEVVRELRTQRGANHLAERLEALWQQERRA